MPDLPANPHRDGEASWQWQIRHFDSIDSTNEYVLEAARAGAAAGLVAVADHQTAGRGRLGRSWEAAAGSSLLVSALLRPDLPVERLFLLTLAAGLALADAVGAVAGVSTGLKWPNDLVVDDKKLAGLLAEADLSAGAARAVVIGAGCNLTANSFPPELAARATAVELEAGRAVDRDALLTAFLGALAERLDDLDAVLVDARTRSATLGRRVCIELPGDEVLDGEATALADDGSLVVRDDDGREHAVAVGDVVHLRPTD
jgi:BirA family transcriptional regulator, biotin operon repressor / biotin---[acetyl-CoA-carboxylase] ligase